jgi:hypothetical protein
MNISRHWSVVARVSLALLGLLSFAAATGFARSNHPSKAKHAAVPLSAPAAFLSEVAKAQLDAGQIAQAQGPTGPVSATS